MKKILLVTKGISHPPLNATLALRSLIEEDEAFRVNRIPTPEDFPEDLDQFDALVLYFHLENISEGALTDFTKYVANGGGVLALHSATASFHSSPEYLNILGGRFIEHDVVSEFVIRPATEIPLFSDIPEFSVIDELYIHETQPDIQVHFTTNLKEETIPVAWSHQYGRGRVFYASPGHRTQTMYHPEYQALILNGLRWVCKLFN